MTLNYRISQMMYMMTPLVLDAKWLPEMLHLMRSVIYLLRAFMSGMYVRRFAIQTLRFGRLNTLRLLMNWLAVSY